MKSLFPKGLSILLVYVLAILIVVVILTNFYPKVEPVTLIAIILGPILAVHIQKHIEKHHALVEQQNAVFITLMTTRAYMATPEKVQAFNMIDLVFDSSKNIKMRSISEAWRAYLSHLSRNDLNEANLPLWSEKTDELFADLLYEMSKFLGYQFDKTYLKESIYVPKHLRDSFDEQLIIRKGFASIFEGKNKLPVIVYEPT